MDAVLAFLKHLASHLVTDGTGLQAKQAGDHLQVVLDPVVDLLEQCLLLPEGGSDSFFALLTLANVTQDDGEDPSVVASELRDRGFRRKLLAVLASREDLLPLSHAPRRLRGVRKFFDVSTVGVDESGRQQRVQRLAADLDGPVTEEPFGTLVKEDDPLLVANGDDGILRQIQNS